MSKRTPTWQQQKELLNLKAEVVRLKLVSEQLKSRSSRQQPTLDWSRWLGMLDGIPLTGLAFKLLNKPKNWRNKIVLGALLSAITLWRKPRQENK
ncbi:hypothetical protein [Snodgrassella sp. CFCC 13594]|uniref:hypothetical protein n=1 Tax=Snodgrassella sp. CFCC 13594 TaxID=1775559 RepID=UPI00082C53A0|nr:hypothetical protein [Snodgrassella sp. CFCC 13594]